MRAEDVAQYLQDNPQFFEEHLETLAQIALPHPHGGRTISLSERQLLALREKNKELEKKLHDLIEFARENDALQRQDYADFVGFTCVGQQRSEAAVLGEQRQSSAAKGARFVDDVREPVITGDRATATVVYHFENSADDKITTEMTFVREDGQWKVCSPGPR